MVMLLRRRSDLSTISDSIEWFSGWQEKYPEPVLETVNGVTYLQKRGRMEWYADVEFMFSDNLPNSTVDDMYLLKRYARNLEWLRFTDRFGDIYDVRVRGIPETERDDAAPLDPVFHMTCRLLIAGYE